MLSGKRVVLGVTGSIAAYKMAHVASMLVNLHCDVHVIMTENATKFITPTTFETLTKNPCYVDTFDRTTPIQVHHIVLGQKSDLIMVAPASADILAKMAYGIADDMLTSTIVAATCPILVAPAMNQYMYQNQIVQDNIERLKKYGFSFIEPCVGKLACDTVGIGKLADEETLVDAIKKVLLENTMQIFEQEIEQSKAECLCQNGEYIDDVKRQDLSNIHILVTAGPTQESLDPVRFITNHSTGKMGYAIAEQAAKRGALVTLVTGPVSLEIPENVYAIKVTTAQDMYDVVMNHFDKQDIVIKAAAVADYRPKVMNQEKTKKSEKELIITFERTKDILLELGKNKKDSQCVCGFSMETEKMLENSRKKLVKKNIDMIAANSLREAGAGFGHDTNHLVLLTKEEEIDLGMQTKSQCADALLDQLHNMWKEKNSVK